MTTAIYLLLCFGHKWNIHQGISITSMFVFNMVWYSKIISMGSLTFDEQITGIISTLTVGIIAAVIHYQKIYTGGLFDVNNDSKAGAIVTHLANWLFIGIGLIVFSPGIIHHSIGLAIAAFLLFVTARIARYRGIMWVYIIDTTLAQLLVLTAICSLYLVSFSYSLIFGALFLECLLFYVAMHYENEIILKKTAKFFMYVAEYATMIGLFVCLYHESLNKLTITYCVIAGSFLAGFAFYCIFSRKDTLDEFGNLLFVFPAMLTFQLGIVDKNFCVYWEALVAALLVVPLIVQRYLPTVSFFIAYGIAVFFLHAISWFSMERYFQDFTLMEQILKTLPLFVLLIGSLCYSFVAALQKNVTWLYIYLFGSNILIFSYIIFRDQSTLMLGVLWLVVSIIFLESALFIEQKLSLLTGNSSKHLLHMGMIFVGAFIGLHFFYHLQLEAILGVISVRLLMQLFAMGIFSYWLTRGWEGIKDKGYACITYIQPLFLELIVVFAIIAMALEIPYIYLAPSWAMLAIVLLCIGEWGARAYNRIRVYSLFLMWNSGIHLATITSSVNYPSDLQLWIIGLGIIGIQFFYLLWITHKNSLQNMSLPAPVAFLEPWLMKLSHRRNSWIFYPFFITVAFFLFWRFDKSFLTLCWTIEVFGIFLLGILLKENNFRTISLGVLVICAVRLIFYDLAQSETLTRGIVFLSFGGILLLMHAIHNFCKNRGLNE